MKFVKGVATVFSVGIAWVCGIWNIKGKEAAQGLQTVLNQPPAPVAHLPGGLAVNVIHDQCLLII